MLLGKNMKNTSDRAIYIYTSDKVQVDMRTTEKNDY